MEEAFQDLSSLTYGITQNISPFVMPIDGGAEIGLAAEQWVIDLLKWTYELDIENTHEFRRVKGLLLGYSPRAITEHDARCFAGAP